jgi:hypothetical protein
MTKAYLLGALHDATDHNNTFRIATKHLSYAQVLQKGIQHLGGNAWIYKEGKKRNIWICEFSKSFLRDVKVTSKQDKIDYCQGYFDAEGGIAKQKNVRYYVYFAQKNKKDLLQVKKYLEEVGIICGIVHNPSKAKDSEYWRFFVRAESYNDFTRIISSSHPEKRQYLRMKI